VTRAALVAVQLEINAQVLASPDAYRLHLETAAARALEDVDRQARVADPDDGWDEDSPGFAGARSNAHALRRATDARVVVFPEVAGSLALYALAPPAARKAKSLAAVLATAAVRRPLDVLRGIATTRLLDARHAVLAAIAPDGERWWKSVFGPLAKQHEAYIVAGSYLRLGADGALTNASLLFGPEGRLLATTDKVNLVVGMEDGSRGGLALHRGESSAVPIVDTPIGKLVTLIGYDACREPLTPNERFVALGPRLVERGGVTIVANPTARKDPSFGLREALAASRFGRFGITAHLVGGILDLSYGGASEIVERTGNAVKVLARAEQADRGGHVTAVVTC
jgi:predicted amidohydrolase